MDIRPFKKVPRVMNSDGTYPPYGTCSYCGTKYDNFINRHAEVYDVCGHIKCVSCARSLTLVCEECEKEEDDKPVGPYPPGYPDYLKVTHGDVKRGEGAWEERIKRINPVFRDMKNIPMFIRNAAVKYPLPQGAPADGDNEADSHEGLVSVVDINTLMETTEEITDDSESDVDDVLQPPRFHVDPISLRECYVRLTRVEEELKIVGLASVQVVNPEENTEERYDNTLVPETAENERKATSSSARITTRSLTRRKTLLTNRVVPEKMAKAQMKASDQNVQKFQRSISSRLKSVSKAKKRVLKRSETNTKRLECPECKNTFANIYILERHLRLHTGDNPFKCDRCEKAFHRSDKLDYHKRKVHRR
ncbi:putative zinc finger protein [Orchesella cincta]|uniref:Putative zinc finger protein n=1 Tax=Orchesella cincta TaxID=48709 RepID=A0A1D2MSA8_ORCCI|nr:putative zinc finger protein [Orchesella cincta]